MLIKEISEIKDENSSKTRIIFDEDGKETEIILEGDGKLKVAASV